MVAVTVNIFFILLLSGDYEEGLDWFGCEWEPFKELVHFSSEDRKAEEEQVLQIRPNLEASWSAFSVFWELNVRK